jgi:HAE1 family hydrophobic/amphiphilic exporter-1
MQKLAEICIRRPVFATMLIGALVVAGMTGYLNLGVDRFPPVDLPTVSVRTELPGASPEEVEIQVSQPIEEVVNTVEGIAELRSISTAGSSFVMATFELSREIDVAAQDVRDRVATVLRRLPRDARPPVVGKFDNDQSPVLTIALSGQRSLRELNDLADRVVKPRLERSAGVGEVRVEGGARRAINVWLDADRLAAYRLPVTAVRDALQRQNADVPGGQVTSAQREQTLRTLGRLDDPRAFNDLVIVTTGGAPIRVRDVGRAEDGTVEQRSSARLNGVPCVTLEVRRQSGANTVAVIDGVTAKLPEVARALPGDVALEVIRDQSRYIRAAMHEIHVHLVLGSILASLVVLAFMRNLRTTIIAAVAIPTSVIATFGMMWALDFTLNSVTMLALVLMVGVVIDDAIVVLENVFRFIEEKGMPPMQAAREATREIGLAVLATTLSLVVIFVPVSFMSSISGRFLYQFGITAAVAVLVSLLVSFTLTPMMSARLLRSGDAAAGQPRSRRGMYGLVERGYLATLRGTLRWRLPVLLLSLLVISTSVPLYGVVRQDYIPSDVDEGEFDVNVSAPQGTSFAAMDEVMRQVEADLRTLPQIRMMLTSVGGGFLSNVSSGGIYVRIAPHEERRFSFPRLFAGILRGEPLAAFRGNYKQSEVMQAVRNELKKYGDLRASVRNPRAFNIGGGPFELDFSIKGPDLGELARYTEELRRKALATGGMVDLDTTLKLDKPELRVTIDRARAADLGVDVSDVASALRTLVGGDPEVSRFQDLTVDEEYDVQLRLREADRTDPAQFGALLIPRRDGDPVRLDNLVTIGHSFSASRIDRLDRQRQVSVRGGVAPGHALADQIAVLRRLAAELGMPPQYSTAVSGRARELERTGREFLAAFLLALVFMYMILASQFESVLHPFLILFSLPIAVPFALLSLLATGNTLNLYSALGILVLFGVVKKNAILQIDHTNQLRAAGLDTHEAILRANRDRLRPILMTTFALVMGMLPLAVGAGPGAEERKAIAVVVIGGQLLSLLLTLLAVPAAYALVAGKRRP